MARLPMVKHFKTTVILGAGASRSARLIGANVSSVSPSWKSFTTSTGAWPSPPPISMPLDADFFELLSRTQDSFRRRHKSLIDRLRKQFGTTWLYGMEAVFTQLEHVALLSQLSQEGSPSAGSDDSLHQMRCLISDLLGLATNQPMDGAVPPQLGCPNHVALAVELGELDDVTILNLNYDLLLEDALLRASEWGRVTGNQWRPAVLGVQFTYASEEASEFWEPLLTCEPNGKRPLELLKLHGSINWSCPDSQDAVQLHLGPVSDPCLAPPVWRKQLEEAPYEKLWRRAIEAVSLTDQLVVIGYSLPPADGPMRALLGAYLRRAGGFLRSVVVADPSDESRMRILSALGRSIGPSTAVYRYNSFEAMLRDMGWELP